MAVTRGSESEYPWPEGRRAAVAVTFDLDAESVMLATDPTSPAGRR